MKGLYDLKLRNAQGMKDEVFLAAMRDGSIDELLNGLPIELHLEGRNLLVNWLVATLLHNCFEHSLPNGPWPTYDACVPFNNISLMTRDTEPTYLESIQWYGGYSDHADNIGTSTGARGFVNQRAEVQNIRKDPSGCEQVLMTTRFLYLPSEAVSNNIRSLGIMGSQYTNQGTGSEDRYMSGRIRLKDPLTGLPVVVNKNLNQVLVLEYTAYFISL